MLETFFTHSFYNDAARRVATSSEKRENRFKPPYSKRETAAKGPSPMPIPFPRAPSSHEPHGFHRDAARRVATNAPSHSRRRPEYTSATRTRRGLALRAEVATHFPRGMSASRPPGMACGVAPSAAPCAES